MVYRYIYPAYSILVNLILQGFLLLYIPTSLLHSILLPSPVSEEQYEMQQRYQPVCTGDHSGVILNSINLDSDLTKPCWIIDKHWQP